MLKEMHLKRVGPAPQFDVEFAERLNIFTGDNGLGKTFLLDIIWCTLTGTWADNPAWPQLTEETPQISGSFNNQTNGETKSFHSYFDFEQQQWRDLTFPALLNTV
ncbi:AAA family ATPase [Aerosakkonemataceae cyanobacterium BLCC-F50]|uniref:AAA family ATPase n=1 Tax=Floridaenema flaviceps BLCC-F50 TaxID=3153642 RepID=A0ABV4XYE2_9CYAN